MRAFGTRPRAIRLERRRRPPSQPAGRSPGTVPHDSISDRADADAFRRLDGIALVIMASDFNVRFVTVARCELSANSENYANTGRIGWRF